MSLGKLTVARTEGGPALAGRPRFLLVIIFALIYVHHFTAERCAFKEAGANLMGQPTYLFFMLILEVRYFRRDISLPPNYAFERSGRPRARLRRLRSAAQRER
jgi:hypothetical protein